MEEQQSVILGWYAGVGGGIDAQITLAGLISAVPIDSLSF